METPLVHIPYVRPVRFENRTTELYTELLNRTNVVQGKSKKTDDTASSNDYPSLITPHPASLLGLPLELRQAIYSHIFHDLQLPIFHNVESRNLLRGDGHGCSCGDGISVVNRQLYKETRFLLYGHAKPRFYAVDKAVQFLQDVQDNASYLTHFSVNLDGLEAGNMLREIFSNDRLGGLHELNIYVYSDAHAHSGDKPSWWATIQSPAAMYDISLRDCRHPLASLKKLRRLRVDGHLPCELEEALIKARINIEDLGKSEGKWTSRWEKQYGPEDWAFGIAIHDDKFPECWGGLRGSDRAPKSSCPPPQHT